MQNKCITTLDRRIWKEKCAAAISSLLLRGGGESISDLHYVTYRMEVVSSSPMQLFIYIFTLGCFTHRVPEFILHKAAGSQNRMRLLLFPKKKKKKQMPKKKQMKGTIQGAKCEMSSKNQTQAQLEVITLQGCRKKGDGNKNPPPPPRQCLRKCWLQQRVGDKTYRKHQELLLFL